MAKTNTKSPDEMSFLDHLEELRWHLVGLLAGRSDLTLFKRVDYFFVALLAYNKFFP